MKTKGDIMFEWIKKYRKLLLIIIFISIFLVPAIIHILFKIYPKNYFFIAEWSAGELLGYYGSILSFLGTVILGALSLYQNHLLKIETDKRTALLEQREHEKNMPKFTIKLAQQNGQHSNLVLKISNITENSAMDVAVFNIRMINNDNVIWQRSDEFNFSILSMDNAKRMELKNPNVTDVNTILLMEMKCKDKYAEEHIYRIKGSLEDIQGYFKFKLTEV